MARQKLIHIHSKVSGQEPATTGDKGLVYGEIAVNYAAGNERLYIKNTSDKVKSFIAEDAINAKLAGKSNNGHTHPYMADYDLNSGVDMTKFQKNGIFSGYIASNTPVGGISGDSGVLNLGSYGDNKSTYYFQTQLLTKIGTPDLKNRYVSFDGKSSTPIVSQWYDILSTNNSNYTSGGQSGYTIGTLKLGSNTYTLKGRDTTYDLSPYFKTDGSKPMTGKLTTVKDNFTDDGETGGIFMNNSNITGLNAMYFCDLSESAREGINFYRDSSHVDTLWGKSGVLYWNPNRAFGASGTDYTIAHSGNVSNVNNYSDYTIGTVTIAGKVLTLKGKDTNTTYSASGTGTDTIKITPSSGNATSVTINDVSNASTVGGYGESSFFRLRSTIESNGNKETLWNKIGLKEYHAILPDGLEDSGAYTYGEVASFPGPAARFDIYCSDEASSTGRPDWNALYFRSGWNASKKPWRKIWSENNSNTLDFDWNCNILGTNGINFSKDNGVKYNTFGEIIFKDKTPSWYIYDKALNPMLYVNNKGQVGIGTNSPSGKFYVNGGISTNHSFYFDNDATMKIYAIDGSEPSCGKETVAIQTAFDWKDPETSTYPSDYPERTALSLQPRGGNVGIGVSAPSSALDVSGNISTSGYIGFGYYGARITSDVKTSWRTSMFGNNSNGSRLRVVRTDANVSKFSKMYGNGLAWGSADTNGFLNVSYSSKNAYIGGGLNDNISWSEELWHTGNLDPSVFITGSDPRLTNSRPANGGNANSANFLNVSNKAQNDSSTSSYSLNALCCETVYQSGFPYSFGNVLTMKGSGGGQMFLTWPGNQTETNTNVETELYLRSHRDCSTGGKWTDWTKVLTNRNYSGYAVPLTGGTMTGDLATKSLYSTSADFYGVVRMLGESAKSDVAYPQFGKFDRASGAAILQLGQTDEFEIIDRDWTTIMASFRKDPSSGTIIKLNGQTHSRGYHIIGLDDSYVICGGGGYKGISDLSVKYAESAGTATFLNEGGYNWRASYSGDGMPSADWLCAWHITSNAHLIDAVSPSVLNVNSAKYIGDASMTMYAQYSNEINFGGTSTEKQIFFGYRSVGNRPAPNSFVFGGSAGTAKITAGSFYEGSDERLKDFTDNLSVDFNKIKEIPKKYYYWKDKENRGDRLQIGTSAQKLREVYPELVNEDKDGYLSVDYAKLSIIALKAVDELNEKNERLEEKCLKMEEELRIIKEKLGL